MAKSMWILEHYIQHIIFCYKGILFSRSSFPQDLGSWLQGFCWHSAIGALAKEDQWWWAIRSGITAYPKDGGQGSLQAIKVLRKLRRSISLFTLCTVALNVLQKYYLYLKIIKEMEFVDMMTMLVMASFRTSGTVGWDQNFKSLYCNPDLKHSIYINHCLVRIHPVLTSNWLALCFTDHLVFFVLCGFLIT